MHTLSLGCMITTPIIWASSIFGAVIIMYGWWNANPRTDVNLCWWLLVVALGIVLLVYSVNILLDRTEAACSGRPSNSPRHHWKRTWEGWDEFNTEGAHTGAVHPSAAGCTAFDFEAAIQFSEGTEFENCIEAKLYMEERRKIDKFGLPGASHSVQHEGELKEKETVAK
jgi:hypothetical protein